MPFQKLESKENSIVVFISQMYLLPTVQFFIQLSVFSYFLVFRFFTYHYITYNSTIICLLPFFSSVLIDKSIINFYFVLTILSKMVYRIPRKWFCNVHNPTMYDDWTFSVQYLNWISIIDLMFDIQILRPFKYQTLKCPLSRCLVFKS